MKKIYLVLTFAVFLVQCCFCTNECIDTKHITVIFDAVKNNYDTVFFSNGATAITPNPVLSFHLSPNKIERIPPNDKIVINPVLDFIIINHKYTPTSSIDFILYPGDTAHIDYMECGFPWISVKNRRVKKYDLNYDYFKRKRYDLSEEMQTTEIMNNQAIYFLKKLIKGKKSISLPKVTEEFYPKLLTELNDENLWLDSIYKFNFISENEYHFFKERNKYANLSLLGRDNSLSEVESHLKEYNDSIYRNDVAGFYRTYFYKTGINYLNIISTSLKGNKITGVYDYIEKSKSLNGKLSQDLREVALDNILKNSTLNLRKDYFNKFSSSILDTTYVNLLQKKYNNLLNAEIAVTNDMVLLTLDNRKTTFAEVIKQCAGKKVYVDFWASWCAPCLMEMPKSKQLRNSKESKDVIFIYLALNDTKEQWEKANIKAELKNYIHNYLILNSKDTYFIKQYKINEIPRYMIFDENGNLVNSNAPRPSNSEIEKFFSAY